MYNGSMSTFYNDIRADIIFHLKRGAVIVSEDDMILSFGRDWANGLRSVSRTLNQDIKYATIENNRIRLSMKTYISD